MKLTKIAVALVAVIAMSAVMASVASAVQLTSTSSPAMLFGEDKGNHVFSVDGQNVTCGNAVFEKASLATPANEVTGVTAAYTECTAFGFAGATVNMGNCTYTFKELGAFEEENKVKANVALACSGASNVNVNVAVFGSECSVSLNATGNSKLGHVVIENTNTNTPFEDIDITATVKGITAQKNKDNGLCPLSGTGTTTNATYNGDTTVRATNMHLTLVK